MSNPAVSGLASDIRRRLLIDRYSSVLSGLPLRRQGSLADPRSADAEIWNVFRTLAQMDPALWLPGLLALGRIRKAPGPAELSAGIGLTLWKRVRPPAERLAWLQRRALRGELRPVVGARRKGRVIPLSKLRDEMKARARRRLPLEDPVEVDAIVKCPRSVLFVEIPAPGEVSRRAGRRGRGPHLPAASRRRGDLLRRVQVPDPEGPRGLLPADPAAACRVAGALDPGAARPHRLPGTGCAGPSPTGAPPSIPPPSWGGWGSVPGRG